MSNYNRVILLGRMTKPIEVKTAASGAPYGNFSVAVNKRNKDEAANFFDVRVFDKTAENMQRYTVKGSLVLVEGELEHQTWNDNDTGQKRSKVIVLGRHVEFVSRPANSESSEPRPQPGDYTNDPNEPAPDDEDSIPF